MDGPLKGILAGKLDSYDIINDPAENRTGGHVSFSPVSRKALDDIRSVPGRAPAREPQRRSAPEPCEPGLRCSNCGAGRSEGCASPRGHGALVRFHGTRISAVRRGALRRGDSCAGEDPRRGSAQPRRGIANRRLSLVARTYDKAVAAFRKASEIAPDSPDVRVYLALHYARGTDWARRRPRLCSRRSFPRRPIDCPLSMRSRDPRASRATGGCYRFVSEGLCPSERRPRRS